MACAAVRARFNYEKRNENTYNNDQSNNNGVLMEFI